MTLIPVDLKPEVLKIIRNDVKLAYWTSNSTKSFWIWKNCVELKVREVKGIPNSALDLISNDIGCNSKKNSICFRENIIVTPSVTPELEIKTVDEDADYDCDDCEL